MRCTIRLELTIEPESEEFHIDKSALTLHAEVPSLDNAALG
jgi:hypothetical protein